MLKIQHDDRPDIEQCLDQFNKLVQDNKDSVDYRSDNEIYHDYDDRIRNTFNP